MRPRQLQDEHIAILRWLNDHPMSSADAIAAAVFPQEHTDKPLSARQGVAMRLVTLTHLRYAKPTIQSNDSRVYHVTGAGRTLLADEQNENMEP